MLKITHNRTAWRMVEGRGRSQRPMLGLGRVVQLGHATALDMYPVCCRKIISLGYTYYQINDLRVTLAEIIGKQVLAKTNYAVFSDTIEFFLF